MHILQINTADIAGGAEAVAWQLLHAYRRLGHDSQLVVGLKRSTDPDVISLLRDECRGPWARGWQRVGDTFRPLEGRVRGASRLRRLCTSAVGQPVRAFNIWRGREDFAFPEIWRMNERLRTTPDIVQCHNLHGAWLPSGGYFDLEALPWLSRRIPLILTLHDAWLLSGHCAHSFGCDRWKHGCGECPDLTIYPAIRRDATAYNWRRKQTIFGQSRVFVSTPCHWLMRRVQESMLAPAVISSRVIPNGVDLSVFQHAEKRQAREDLGLPQQAKVLFFVAHGVRGNIWKDYATMKEAVRMVAAHLRGQEVIFLALGEEGDWEESGEGKIRFVPFQDDQRKVARYYQAADIYVHAARADTFPNTVLEALACGLPVVATAVGGIDEQVVEGQTGFLVPAGDADGMAGRIVQLLRQPALLAGHGRRAEQDARQRFDVRRQVTAYLEWFEEILMGDRQGAIHPYEDSPMGGTDGYDKREASRALG
ncbi:MAG: glycosyltransferase [Nitrospiraceae bacterium]